MFQQSDIAVAPLSHWWKEMHALHRFVSDLIVEELYCLRPGPTCLPPCPWDAAVLLEDDLGIDSLERLQLATRLAQALDMSPSDSGTFLLEARSLGHWIEIAAASLTQANTQLYFLTSGSTGTPKSCRHTVAALEQEISALTALLPDRKRILFAVPSQHIYGFLWTILLPHALGLAAHQVIDVRRQIPASLAGLLQSGDLVIGYPEFWTMVARAGFRFPPDVVGITATGPCPDTVGTLLEDAGLAGFVHLYGTSETAGIAWRRDNGPYQLLPYWYAVPGSPQLLACRHPDGSLHQSAAQDALAWEGERTFRLGPRTDTAVQVGGVNVFPAYISNVLCAHPGVRQASVRLMHPAEGSRLKAFIVPMVPGNAEVQAQFQADLMQYASRMLRPSERPKSYLLGAALPRTEQGKAADWPIGQRQPVPQAGTHQPHIHSFKPLP